VGQAYHSPPEVFTPGQPGVFTFCPFLGRIQPLKDEKFLGRLVGFSPGLRKIFP